MGRTKVKFGQGIGALVLLWGLYAAAEAPKAPRGDRRMAGPSLRISLESIKAPVVSPNFARVGASMLTLHLLDDTHLLVTFATRELVPRQKDDPPTDEDRIVAGEIVELPSIKVLARTTWHMHDHARYIWPLGEGRFALRIGSNLSVLAPMANLGTENAFQRVAMPHQPGMPLSVSRSADAELISVLTELSQPKGKEVQLGDADAVQHHYAIDFFRIKGAGTAASPLLLDGAGVVRSTQPFVLPLDADGYLWPTDDKGRGHWDITFNGFGGQQLKAGAVDSSCAPRLLMASRSQYLALACRGSEGLPRLVAMGLDGYEPWEENFSEFAEAPNFVFSPDAGRFAMQYTTTTTVPATGDLPATESTNQEVRVYQMESGDLLQRVACSPQFRVPENFDLSPSGRTLVVLHDAEILLYTLPELSKEDRADLDEVQKLRPPVSSGKVVLTRMTEQIRETAAGTTEKAQSEQQALDAPVSTTTAAGAGPLPGAKGNEIRNGDAGGPRKRPTLLEPGEVPEFKDKTAPVQ